MLGVVELSPPQKKSQRPRDGVRPPAAAPFPSESPNPPGLEAPELGFVTASSPPGGKNPSVLHPPNPPGWVLVLILPSAASDLVMGGLDACSGCLGRL